MAASEVHDLDERRKALATVNPKLAKDSELPPEPRVSDITFEHFAMNLPAMAREALENLTPATGATVPSDESDGSDKSDESDGSDKSDSPESTETA